jgi:hypothetical protein
MKLAGAGTVGAGYSVLQILSLADSMHDALF